MWVDDRAGWDRGGSAASFVSGFLLFGVLLVAYGFLIPPVPWPGSSLALVLARTNVAEHGLGLYPVWQLLTWPFLSLNHWLQWQAFAWGSAACAAAAVALIFSWGCRVAHDRFPFEREWFKWRKVPSSWRFWPAVAAALLLAVHPRWVREATRPSIESFHALLMVLSAFTATRFWRHPSVGRGVWLAAVSILAAAEVPVMAALMPIVLVMLTWGSLMGRLSTQAVGFICLTLLGAGTSFFWLARFQSEIGWRAWLHLPLAHWAVLSIMPTHVVLLVFFGTVIPLALISIMWLFHTEEGALARGVQMTILAAFTVALVMLLGGHGISILDVLPPSSSGLGCLVAGAWVLTYLFGLWQVVLGRLGGLEWQPMAFPAVAAVWMAIFALSLGSSMVSGAYPNQTPLRVWLRALQESLPERAELFDPYGTVGSILERSATWQARSADPRRANRKVTAFSEKDHGRLLLTTQDLQRDLLRTGLPLPIGALYWASGPDHASDDVAKRLRWWQELAGAWTVSQRAQTVEGLYLSRTANQTGYHWHLLGVPTRSSAAMWKLALVFEPGNVAALCNLQAWSGAQGMNAASAVYGQVLIHEIERARLPSTPASWAESYGFSHTPAFYMGWINYLLVNGLIDSAAEVLLRLENMELNSSAMTLCLRGEVERSAGNWIQARQAYDRALGVAGSQGWTVRDRSLLAHRLADACVAQGDLLAAAAAYRTSVEFFPNNAAAWSGLGRVLAAEKHYHDAATAFERSLRLVEDQDDIRESLALVLMKLGQRDEARRILSALALKTPDNARVHAALRLLEADTGKGRPEK